MPEGLSPVYVIVTAFVVHVWLRNARISRDNQSPIMNGVDEYWK